jgi:hypothetical protein
LNQREHVNQTSVSVRLPSQSDNAKRPDGREHTDQHLPLRRYFIFPKLSKGMCPIVIGTRSLQTRQRMYSSTVRPIAVLSQYFQDFATIHFPKPNLNLQDFTTIHFPKLLTPLTEIPSHAQKSSSQT